MVEIGLWILSLISLTFTALLVFLISALFKKTKSLNPIPDLTILLAFKNEAHFLPKAITRFKSLLEINEKLQVILINDHSTDNYFEKIKIDEKWKRIKKFDLPVGLSGKKAAVSYGMEKATTSWVLVVDADTEIPDDLILPYTRIIQSTDKCILVPIQPKKEEGLIRSFFDLEFLSLHAAGLASANIHLPLLANGACMFICRKAYLETKKVRTDWKEASGDDVFTMFAISNFYGRKTISALQGVMAVAHFPKRGKNLFNQRLRWVAKTGQIKNVWFQFVSILVLSSQLALILGCFIFLKYGVVVIPALFMLLAILSAMTYLIVATAYLKRRDLWVAIAPAVLIYPFYLIVLLIFSTFAKPKWK